MLSTLHPRSCWNYVLDKKNVVVYVQAVFLDECEATAYVLTAIQQKLEVIKNVGKLIRSHLPLLPLPSLLWPWTYGPPCSRSLLGFLTSLKLMSST